MGRSRGGGGGRGPDPTEKNHKNTGLLSITGPDPMENHKATKPAFNVGPPLGDDGPLFVVFGSSSSSSTKK